MNDLEYLLRYLSPAAASINDHISLPSLSYCLNHADAMSILNDIESRCRAGLNLYSAKLKLCCPERALEEIHKLARQLIEESGMDKLIDEKVAKPCLQILCFYAFQDYSGETFHHGVCTHCKGTGWVDATPFRLKYKHNVSHTKPLRYLEEGVSAFPDRARVQRVVCVVCGGQGVTHQACACQGRGQVMDRKASQTAMQPVYKPCAGCKGKGFRKVKFATILNSLQTFWAIKNTTAYQHVKPFYEELVARCHQEEMKLEEAVLAVFQRELDTQAVQQEEVPHRHC